MPFFDTNGNWYEPTYTWNVQQQQTYLTLAQLQAMQGVLQQPVAVKRPKRLDLIADTEGMRVANTFLLGCDPEAVVVNATGQQVNVLEEGIPMDGEVGADHGGRVLEFRPAPAYSAYTLIKRLQALVKAPILAPIRPHKWRGGAFFARTPGPANRTIDDEYYPDEPPRPATRPAHVRGDGLGGHIHLDIQRPDYNFEYDELVSSLNRITKYCEHLDILPQSECLARRRNTNYGQWSDYRNDIGRLEYRTMSSWMFSPVTAFVCLTAAKCAALDPEGATDCLPTKLKSFEKFRDFLEGFKTKDADAARVCDKLLPLGVKGLQKDPDVDIKEAWEKLPI